MNYYTKNRIPSAKLVSVHGDIQPLQSNHQLLSFLRKMCAPIRWKSVCILFYFKQNRMCVVVSGSRHASRKSAFTTKTTQNPNTHLQGNKLKHISLMIGRALCNVLGHSSCNEKKKEISKVLKEMSLYNLKFPNEISLKGKARTNVQGLYLALGFLGFPQVGWNLAV